MLKIDIARATGAVCHSILRVIKLLEIAIVIGLGYIFDVTIKLHVSLYA